MVCVGFGIYGSFNVFNSSESSTNFQNSQDFSFPLEDTTILQHQKNLMTGRGTRNSSEFFSLVDYLFHSGVRMFRMNSIL